MSESSDHERKEEIAAALLAHLLAAKNRRRETARDAIGARGRVCLREWQAARLARSHADLLANPRYGPAARFFLSDLYTPKDLAERDDELERIYPLLVKMLPASALHAMALAVELDALTEDLDSAMVGELRAAGFAERIDDDAYAAAYRAVGRRAERIRQIVLIRETGEALEALAGKPLLNSLLRLMRGPAHLAGLGELQEFLESGFAAFRHMGDADEFLDGIERKEQRLLDKLFGEVERPFDV